MTDVTTVLGAVPADRLGRVDAHEHVFLRSPILPGDEFLDLDRMTKELTDVGDSGIQTVVDLTPIGLGRAPTKTAALSERSGVNIIMATGVHRKAHYQAGHWLYDIDVDELAALMVTDLTEGIDDRDWQGPTPRPTSIRAGVIKLGASYHTIQTPERRWFEAGAAAAVRTGAPVAVHTEVGTAAHDVLDVLEAHGVAPHRVMLAHLDRNIDPDLHADIARRGAFLGYDTVGRAKYHSDGAVVDLIAAVADRGFASNILLGTDVGRSSTLAAYGGGPGMAVLGRTFLPRLSARIGAEAEHGIVADNPRNFLTSTA